MGNTSIQNSILVTNPTILLEKDEKKAFDALGYLKIFVSALHSIDENALEATPDGIEKAVNVLNTQGRIVGYSTFTGYLCTAVAKQVKDSVSLSAASNILNVTNTLVFGALYGVAAVQNSYQLAKDQNLSDLLKQKDNQVLQELVQNLCMPISRNLDELKASWSQLTPEAQETKKQQFKQKLQETALEILALPQGHDKTQEILKSLQKPVDGIEILLGLTDQDYWELNPLEAIGLVITQQKVKKRNWTELKKMTNTEVAKSVDKAYRRGLLERINSDNPAVNTIANAQMKQLIGRVRVESNQTKRIHKGLLIINLLGAIVSLVGLVTLPLGIGIAITVISCLVTIAAIGLNTYLARKELLDSPCGKHDKAFVITAALLFGLSLAALTGITIVFGLSLVQLGLILGIGGFLGGGFLGYYYHLLGQKDKLWKEAHPSLEVFQKLIAEKRAKKEGWDKEVHNVFKKLPKNLRRSLRQKYEKTDIPNLDKVTLGNEISAYKKTSKFFWQKYLASSSEEDRRLALEVQSVYDGLALSNKYTKKLEDLQTELKNNKLSKEKYEKSKEKYTKEYEDNLRVLDNAKKSILHNERIDEINDQLKKNHRYIFHRKSSLSNLAQQIEKASQELLMQSSIPYPA